MTSGGSPSAAASKPSPKAVGRTSSVRSFWTCFAIGLFVSGFVFSLHSSIAETTRDHITRLPALITTRMPNVGFAQRIPSRWSNSKQSRAVVQIFDPEMGPYHFAIMSTRQAMLDLSVPDDIDHVVFFKKPPRGAYPDSYVKTLQSMLAAMRAAGIKIVAFSRWRLLNEISIAGGMGSLEGWGGGLEDTPVAAYLDATFKDGHWKKFLAKVAVFNMTSYDRVVFLDNDVIPVQSVEELFRVEATPACAPDMASGFMLNTGVMVLDPSVDTFRSMIKEIVRKKVTPWRSAGKGNHLIDNDQDFINYFFGNRMAVLNPYWNLLFSIHHEDGPEMMTSPFEDWGAGVKDSGRFIEYALRFRRNRRMIKIVHMSCPKPTWPIFNYNCVKRDSNRFPELEKVFPDYKCPEPDTVPSPRWWMHYYQNSGVPGAAVLALFKTFWLRYVTAMDTICNPERPAAPGSAVEEFRKSAYSEHACAKAPSYIIDDDSAPFYHDFLPTLVNNTRVHTWDFLLDQEVTESRPAAPASDFGGA